MNSVKEIVMKKMQNITDAQLKLVERILIYTWEVCSSEFPVLGKDKIATFFAHAYLACLLRILEACEDMDISDNKKTNEEE